MFAFIIGLVIGLVAASIFWVVFGKNNKRKAERLRNAVVGEYHKIPEDIRKKLDEFLN